MSLSVWGQQVLAPDLGDVMGWHRIICSFLSPMPRETAIRSFRYPNHSLNPVLEDSAPNAATRSHVGHYIDSGNEFVACQVALVSGALRPFDLDRVGGRHNNYTSREVLKVFRGSRPEREGVGAGWQSFQGKISMSIRDGTLVRLFFHDHVDRGNTARFLATVNNRRCQSDGAQDNTSHHVLHDFRV
jgi:hypothetical protein